MQYVAAVGRSVVGNLCIKPARQPGVSSTRSVKALGGVSCCGVALLSARNVSHPGRCCSWDPDQRGSCGYKLPLT